MDTRTKIISLAQAQSKLEGGKWLIVAGYFDPMTAAVAQRVEDLSSEDVASRILIAVLENPGSLLTSGERCVLMAGLRIVDNVIAVGQNQLDKLPSDGERVRCVVDFEADRINSNEFTELILKKEQSARRLDGAAV